jgi:hypothetical protein
VGRLAALPDTYWEMEHPAKSQVAANVAGSTAAAITCAQDPASQACAVSSGAAAAGIAIPEPNIDLAIDIGVLCYDLGICSW